ncbi:hypothetical protein OOT00_12040 [Desulfobotulus sp. H1]|uniref:Uncharacterized protein n=1 Tax=Desulfobotulus pelophilus TaxID=2823377 RepID=A0ABT3NCM5_9BACT|nr:hypothetical protein [Desulfobotulus pelophilus]MCW7754712.1 hypothetical protein [Desulfobotulus pelophilus]
MGVLHLDLSRHCIVTEIKRQQERAVSLALKGKMDQNIVERAEILRQVLENTDLKLWRGKFAELQGGSRETVRLSWGPDGVWLSLGQRDYPL